MDSIPTTSDSVDLLSVNASASYLDTQEDDEELTTPAEVCFCYLTE